MPANLRTTNQYTGKVPKRLEALPKNEAILYFIAVDNDVNEFIYILQFFTFFHIYMLL